MKNRTKFRDQLLALDATADKAVWMRALLDVVNGLNKPCLRLEMMQAILGLDDRWERDYLVASLLFAYECVLTSSGGSTNKPAKQPVHQALAAAAARRGTRLR